MKVLTIFVFVIIKLPSPRRFQGLKSKDCITVFTLYVNRKMIPVKTIPEMGGEKRR
jgi:hypothetical protein